jgi:hypothetical protein
MVLGQRMNSRVCLRRGGKVAASVKGQQSVELAPGCEPYQETSIFSRLHILSNMDPGGGNNFGHPVPNLAEGRQVSQEN